MDGWVDDLPSGINREWINEEPNMMDCIIYNKIINYLVWVHVLENSARDRIQDPELSKTTDASSPPAACREPSAILKVANREEVFR